MSTSDPVQLLQTPTVDQRFIKSMTLAPLATNSLGCKPSISWALMLFPSTLECLANISAMGCFSSNKRC